MNLKEQVNRLKECLVDLNKGREEASNGEIPKLEEELTTAYEYEEHYWKEKPRVNWLIWGDQNTKFFHIRFQARNRRNKIWKLEDGRGGWCKGSEKIGERVREFF